MTRFKVTHVVINGFSKEETLNADDYFIKDGWLHFSEGANHRVFASLRESDVLRIERVSN